MICDKFAQDKQTKNKQNNEKEILRYSNYSAYLRNKQSLWYGATFAIKKTKQYD